MPELDLPADLAPLFEAVRQPLGEYLGGEHHLRLGSGAALIARWRHRRSRDVDFFVEADRFRPLYEHRVAFQAELNLRTGRTNVVRVRRGAAQILLADGGEVSVGTPPPFTDRPESAETVRGTRVRLETSSEIMVKKIRGRMTHNGTFVPRDLYDLAVARHDEPAALAATLQTVPAADLEDRERASVPGESGILVNVHAGSSKADGLRIPTSFGHRARMNNLLRDHT